MDTIRPDARCGSCRWYAADLQTVDEGECRRRAPYPVQGAPNDYRLFPIVKRYDSCGEWGISVAAMPDVGAWADKVAEDVGL